MIHRSKAPGSIMRRNPPREPTPPFRRVDVPPFFAVPGPVKADSFLSEQEAYTFLERAFTDPIVVEQLLPYVDKNLLQPLPAIPTVFDYKISLLRQLSKARISQDPSLYNTLLTLFWPASPSNRYSPDLIRLPKKTFPKHVFNQLREWFLNANAIEDIQFQIESSREMFEYFNRSSEQLTALRELIDSLRPYFGKAGAPIASRAPTTPTQAYKTTMEERFSFFQRMIKRRVKAMMPNLLAQEQEDVVQSVWSVFMDEDDCNRGTETTSGRCVPFNSSVPIIESTLRGTLISDTFDLIDLAHVDLAAPTLPQSEVLLVLDNAARKARASYRKVEKTTAQEIVGEILDETSNQDFTGPTRDPFQRLRDAKRQEVITETIDNFKRGLVEKGKVVWRGCTFEEIMLLESHLGQKRTGFCRVCNRSGKKLDGSICLNCRGTGVVQYSNYHIDNDFFKPRKLRYRTRDNRLRYVVGNNYQTSPAFEALTGEKWKYIRGTNGDEVERDTGRRGQLPPLVLAYHGMEGEQNPDLRMTRGRVILLPTDQRDLRSALARLSLKDLCKPKTLPGTPAVVLKVDNRASGRYVTVVKLRKTEKPFLYRVPERGELTQNDLFELRAKDCVPHPCPACCKILEEINTYRAQNGNPPWGFPEVLNFWKTFKAFLSGEMDRYESEELLH